ncbi:hypothetical protein I302_103719 [Kwoniella bestiolae CBS 10118]|uniref:Uncharacterized protein n=1 Tax=Kwoniella bestiolae CBS 10118 TaxID=1296100 RepID=A0A1B9G987_9TREE|nr:hypothetical protein I302_02422 [Kwoniella bestiolae CBS 10118]OCF27579.1 hypothetical protein I302_02422 [Kwoniella bestiolae CBS 10118]
MVALSNHPIRALSPITELTTPTSLRTLRLPLDETDYQSEPNRQSRYDQEQEEEDDASVYSQLSAETVRNTPQPQPSTPTRQRTLSLPVTPTPPPRSPNRLNLNTSNSSLNNSIPFPQSQPAPGGLPPPLRTQANTKPKLIRRVTPPPASPLLSHMERSENDARREDVEMNMAGIGSGRSLLQEGRVRSVSLVDSGSPEKNTPSTSLDLHNVPLLDLPSRSLSKEIPAPPRSRPNSLKKRPKSYHGSRPNNIRSRPNSFHGGSSKANSTTSLVTPALGLDPTTTPMHVQAKVMVVDSQPATTSFTKPSPRPTLISHQSESSLLARAKSARSTTPTKKSPRRRRVSAIFSSIFGTSEDKEKDHVARKLSRNSRKTSGSGISSRGPSPTPNSPGVALSDSPVQGDPIGPIQSAIRTSGTFGIRDDGSELSSGHIDPPHRHNFDRTGSGSGSVTTQSEGVKRVLYVENVVSTPEAEEDVHEIAEGSKGASSEEGRRQGSSSTSSDHRTPPHSKVTPLAMVGLLPSSGQNHPHSSPELTAHDPSFGRSLSLSLNGSVPSRRNSTSSDYPRINVLPPARMVYTPTSTDLQHSSSSHLSLSGIPENMVDESIQTSTQPSPAKSARSRPLPRPPSTTTSPIATPKPTFIPPLPPSIAPTTELPLLIASHLLSTHAAALLRHSSSMKEVSETMHKMARESLDWGGVLMGMAQRNESVDGLPRILEQQHGHEGYEGIPLPKSPVPLSRPATYMSHSVSLVPPTQPGVQDPIQQAYNALNGLSTAQPPRPGMKLDKIQLPTPEVRRRKGESLPADLLKEAQRLGNEGWTNLHKAEEAWSEAMRGLAEIIRTQATTDEPPTQEHANGNSTYAAGIASSLHPGTSSNEYSPSPSSENVNPRYSALPLSPISTTLSYPLGSPNTVHRNTSMSFLPEDGDMRSQLPLTPSASSHSHSHLSFPIPGLSGHPFQNALNGIPPIDPGHSQSTLKIGSRPHSVRPTFGFQPEPQVYTPEHLGFSATFTPIPSPAPLSSSLGTEDTSGRNKMTPSRSTMTSSDHSPDHPSGSAIGASTRGRKLAKKRTPPSASKISSGSVGAGGSFLASENGSMREKKHWWNRKG